VIAAPPDRVYAALVDPGALEVWLPPEGMSGRFERFEARPGGSYRMVLTHADASPEDHAAGLASSLANLAAHVERGDNAERA
jgi:uncharacterized protein YndB with AHSA1/START domain